MAELWTLITIVFYILVIAVPLMIAMAYVTYAERKVIGAMQLRQGPMTVGPFGLLQPLADGVKLFLKETVIPSGANKFVFIMAPMVTFVLALMGWAVIPFGEGLVLADINVGVLYLLAISSLGVYGIIMAGWASNSRYAFLGALRSAAQMVSYEIAIGLIIINVLITAGTLNLSEIVESQRGLWYFIPHFPMFVIFIVSILAETNRHPFDLPEDEATLVTGYNVEYSSMAFALFFSGRIYEHDPDERHLLDPVPGWLAAAARHRTAQLDSGTLVADPQDLLRAVHLHRRESDLASLSLRSTDEARMEGVSALVAGLGRGDLGFPGLFRHAAEVSA